MLMEEKRESSENISRGERRRLQREEAKRHEKFEKGRVKNEDSKKSFRTYAIAGGILLLVIAGIFGIVMATSKNNDRLAQCLKDKGAVIYGNEWCQYTQRQKDLFGSSFSRLNYVVCDENATLCDEKRVRITPTWEINGRMVEQVQPLKALAALSNCTG